MGKNNKPNNGIGVGGDANDAVIVSGSGNTITINKRDEGSPKHKPEPPKHKIDTLQSIAIVVIFVVLVIFGVFALNPSMLSGAAGTATETVTSTSTQFSFSTNANIPTDTHTPIVTVSYTSTPTDTPTLTPSPIPPVPIGEDWMKGCISKLWLPYPVTIQLQDNGNGCWKEPVHVFSAEFGDLDFLAERTGRGDAEIYGLFAPLPTDTGNITFTVRFKELTNVDLWMGIFPSPNVDSNGLLLVIPDTTDIQRNTILQKDMATYQTMQGTIALPQGNGYSISFTFTPLSVIGKVNPAVFATNSFPMASQQKWLFFGYKGLRGAYRIEGTFLSFELK